MSQHHPTLAESAAAAIDSAIASGDREPTLTGLAGPLGVTPSALKAAFIRELGITPKAYAAARKAERFREALQAGAPVGGALFEAGYGSTSRVYERSGELLGMTPAAYRKGGPDERIGFSFADTSLGRIVVASTERGVCMIVFGESHAELEAQVRARFPVATVSPSDSSTAEFVGAVVSLIDAPARPDDASASKIPLDLRGTVFQQRVWLALTRIEPGRTVTYAELAKQIGQPTAVRAVAQACGANPLAVVVPCHRVIGADGSLTGYRWGTDRKRVLLERERHEDEALG